MQAGPGRVLDVLASSAVPLRPDTLALLMHERAVEEALRAYQGDLTWSILQSLHAMCKSRAKIPSYSDMVDKLRPKRETKRQELTNDQVIARVNDMLNTFLPKGG